MPRPVRQNAKSSTEADISLVSWSFRYRSLNVSIQCLIKCLFVVGDLSSVCSSRKSDSQVACYEPKKDFC
jgi:hypothetical protein